MAEEARLQVALDLMQLDRAIQIARESVEGGVDWLEAGTPLIKSEGMESVRALKKEFVDRRIVADMKTMDTGAFEVEIASKAGSDIVVIMAQADDTTILESVKAARRYGSEIVADLIGVEDSVRRAKEVQELGVDYLCVHVSIDEQMIAKGPLETLRAVCEVSRVPVAVAGGLNSETVVEAVKAGASIVIVGGAIIKAAKVKEATEAIKEALRTQKIVKTDLFM